MKAFGTWGIGASFSLGGVIGCTLGLAGIALGGWVPLVGLGVAIVAGAVAGAAINAWDRATGDFDKEIAKASTAKVATKTVSGKLLTGVAVTGYVALAAVTVVDVAKPIIETNPTAVIATTSVSVAQPQPTYKPTQTLTESTIPTSNEVNICKEKNPSATEIELIHCSVGYEMVACEQKVETSDPSIFCKNSPPNFLSIIMNPGVFYNCGENVYCHTSGGWTTTYTYSKTDLIIDDSNSKMTFIIKK